MKHPAIDIIHGELTAHEAEITLLRILILALIDESSSRQRVLASFLNKAENYCNSVPHGTDEEYLVEVRARLQFYVQLLSAN